MEKNAYGSAKATTTVTGGSGEEITEAISPCKGASGDGFTSKPALQVASRTGDGDGDDAPLLEDVSSLIETGAASFGKECADSEECCIAESSGLKGNCEDPSSRLYDDDAADWANKSEHERLAKSADDQLRKRKEEDDKLPEISQGEVVIPSSDDLDGAIGIIDAVTKFIEDIAKESASLSAAKAAHIASDAARAAEAAALAEASANSAEEAATIKCAASESASATDADRSAAMGAMRAAIEARAAATRERSVASRMYELAADAAAAASDPVESARESRNACAFSDGKIPASVVVSAASDSIAPLAANRSYNSLEEVENAIKELKRYVKSGISGPYLVRRAIEKKDDKAVRMLVRQLGADPNGFVPVVVPLYEACMHGTHAAIEELLSAGADPNVPGRVLGSATAMLPIEIACFKRDDRMAKMLLKNGADPDSQRSAYPLSPLCTACSTGQTEMVRALLDAGANPNAHSHCGTTPLVSALTSSTESGRLAIVNVLLAKGADPDLRPFAEEVEEQGDIGSGGEPGECIKVGPGKPISDLLKKKVDENEDDTAEAGRGEIGTKRDGLRCSAALAPAASFQDENKESFVGAACGSSPSSSSSSSSDTIAAKPQRRFMAPPIFSSVIGFGIGAGCGGVLEALLKAGADPNARCGGDRDMPVLMTACLVAAVREAAALIAAGARVDERGDRDDYTSLMHAVGRHGPVMTKMLVDAGADVNARSSIILKTAPGAQHQQQQQQQQQQPDTEVLNGNSSTEPAASSATDVYAGPSGFEACKDVPRKKSIALVRGGVTAAAASSGKRIAPTSDSQSSKQRSLEMWVTPLDAAAAYDLLHDTCCAVGSLLDSGAKPSMAHETYHVLCLAQLHKKNLPVRALHLALDKTKNNFSKALEILVRMKSLEVLLSTSKKGSAEASVKTDEPAAVAKRAPV